MTAKHKGPYPGQTRERARLVQIKAERKLGRLRGGRPPRLHLTAAAPKHAHLWTRGIENSLPKHRKPEHSTGAFADLRAPSRPVWGVV